MDVGQYLEHDATSLAALVRDGDVSATELREAATTRHERTHGAINAVVEWYPDPEPPTAVADPRVGPLAGVPFLRKDAGATEAGRLAEMGSLLMAGHRPAVTSPYIEAMVGAGVQILGRSAVPEFAQHGTTESAAFGITRNPVDLSTSSGGSSGGAASAVRAGVVPIAHAADAAGSIRIPAAVTGLLGLKPTRGRVPASADRWNGLLCEFVLARSVSDIEACLAVLADGAVVPSVGPLRIAISVDNWAGRSTEPEVVAATEATARLLEGRGHRLEVIDPPIDYEQLMTTWVPLFSQGVVAAIAAGAATTGRPLSADYLEPHTLEVIERVAELAPDADRAARAAATSVSDGLAANLAEFDVLLTPTLGRAVIPLGRMAGDCPMDRYLIDTDDWFDRLYLANTSGWPAMSVPAPGVGPIPIGVQLMAAPNREAHLLRLARHIVGEGVIPAIG